MENRELKSILQDALESEFPASQIDLLSGVREHLVAETTQQGEKMNTVVNSRRLSRLALGALVVGALLAVAFVTPRGRALAQQFLGFFQTGSEATFPATPVAQTVIPTVVAPVQNVTALPASDRGQCGQIVSATSDYVCQLLAAEDSLGFEIRVFSKAAVHASLNTDLSFISLAADPSTQSVRLVFTTSDGVNFWLAEGIGDFPKARVPWEIVPETAVQTPQVGDYPAEYLMGDFVQWAGSQAFTWEENVANTQRLRWREGERWFELRSMGGGREMSRPFDKAGLISLAETLIPMSQGADQLAGIDSPGLDQRAGFHVRQPSVLPKGFQLCHAGYDAGYDGPTAFLSYCDGASNSVVIDQIPVAQASPYDFKERWGEPIKVTPIQVGAVSGYYAVRGDGIQVIMWEENGVRTQIVFQWDGYSDTGMRIDQAGMLAIAKSMK